MNKDFLDKLKNILGMPAYQIEEQAPVEEPVQVQAADVAPAEEPVAEAPETETPADENGEKDKMAQLEAAIADIQNRLTLLESAMSMSKETEQALASSQYELKETQAKLQAVVELIANEPSAPAPVVAASQFTQTKKQNISNEARIKNMLSMLAK